MPKLVIHPDVSRAIEACTARQTHAIMIVGPTGSGKHSLAKHLSAQLLGLDVSSLESYPYLLEIQALEAQSISISQVREIQQFMSLKIPSKQSIARIVLIPDCHQLTTEAQNALLKILEEPPADSILVLTASHQDLLLPTIQSRVQTLRFIAPRQSELEDYFTSLGYPEDVIKQKILVSGGLPGLTHALLTEDTSHQLFAATAQARDLLMKSTFERLTLVDELSKQKQQVTDVLFVLTQMARMALIRSKAQATESQRWTRVLKACYAAKGRLEHNAQAKLVLTNLMLDL